MEKIDHGITVASKFGAVFLAGWLASSAYHATLVHAQKAQKLEVLQTQVVPKLADVAGCEAKRADLATKAIQGAPVDLTAIPNCPSPAKVLSKAASPVRK